MNRASAPSYDLFKLIVTIVLVVILILMLLRGCATAPASPMPAEGISSPVNPEVVPITNTAEGVTPSLTSTSSPTTAPATPTPTSEPVTPTTALVTETPAAVTEPAATDVTPTATTGVETTSCNTSVPSRLSVGEQAQVVQRLNMRSAASITAPILQTNPVNAQVEIIGGPVCTPIGDRAYLWWQIRLANGAEGWSAESPLNEATHLLEPIQ